LRVEFSMTGSAVPAGRFWAASVVAEQSNAAASLVQSIKEIAKRNYRPFLQAVSSPISKASAATRSIQDV